jgi:hypothetical protein
MCAMNSDILENLLHVGSQTLQLGVSRFELEQLQQIEYRIQPTSGLYGQLLRLLLVRLGYLYQESAREPGRIGS